MTKGYRKQLFSSDYMHIMHVQGTTIAPHLPYLTYAGGILECRHRYIYIISTISMSHGCKYELTYYIRYSRRRRFSKDVSAANADTIAHRTIRRRGSEGSRAINSAASYHPLIYPSSTTIFQNYSGVNGHIQQTAC